MAKTAYSLAFQCRDIFPRYRQRLRRHRISIRSTLAAPNAKVIPYSRRQPIRRPNVVATTGAASS